MISKTKIKELLNEKTFIYFLYGSLLDWNGNVTNVPLIMMIRFFSFFYPWKKNLINCWSLSAAKMNNEAIVITGIRVEQI